MTNRGYPKLWISSIYLITKHNKSSKLKLYKWGNYGEIKFKN